MDNTSTDPRVPVQVPPIDQEARDVIYGDREQTYGHPSKNLQLIADFWTSYLKGKEVLTCDDVCNMMILMKTARLKNMPDHRDSLVDTIGYTLLKERCREKEDPIKQSIDNMTTRLNTKTYTDGINPNNIFAALHKETYKSKFSDELGKISTDSEVKFKLLDHKIEAYNMEGRLLGTIFIKDWTVTFNPPVTHEQQEQITTHMTNYRKINHYIEDSCPNLRS